MSIASELTRIQSAKANIASAIIEKGGSVPTGALLDAFAGAILAIPSGGDTSAEDGIITKEISGSYMNSRVSRVAAVFEGCTSLEAVAFPACTGIAYGAFKFCKSLTTISFPVCTMIGDEAFMSCSSLTAASFPECTTVGSRAFGFCTSLETAYFPKCTTISQNTFQNCYSLTTVFFPKCTTIKSYAFSGCYSLETVSFPECSTIEMAAFSACYHLTSLFLPGSSICSLPYSTAFTFTPIAGYTSSTSGVYGSIFVPASLVDAYKSATNWTYFASRIAAIPES